MSNDLPIYGMDKEIQAKKLAKRDTEREAVAQQWIEEVTGEKLSGSLEEALKDGLVLCKLVNTIKPGSAKKVTKSKLAFMQMQNINSFLEGAKKLGVPKHDLFVTVDLYEAKNIAVVVDCIYSLGSICQKLDGYNGPSIGVKRSDKTEYNFTEEQLLKARSAPSKFSEGGKGCASQAGTRSISHDVVKTSDTGSREGVSMLNEGGKGCSSQAGTRSISRNVVKTKDTGTLGSVSRLNEGGKGCSSQAGTRSISRDVVKTKDTGSLGSVSILNEGGKGCDSQAGTFSISHEVVKTQDTGIKGSVSQLNEGSKGCPSQAGNTSISNEVVKVKK